MISRKRAREIARELFPCNLYDHNYSSYDALSQRDPIARDDLLDHIQYNEPLNQGSIKEYEN